MPRPATDAYQQAVARRRAIEACTDPRCGGGYRVGEDGRIEDCDCAAPFRGPLAPLPRMDQG